MAIPTTGTGVLDRYFRISERGSSLGIETRAGVTTFMVMAYIIFVNASILSAAGFDAASVAAVTALVAGIMTIAMGVFSNYPLAMAAGLGINGAVAFGLVLGSGLTPAGAMGVIVIEGLVVTVLVLAGFREAVMKAVPASLKRAIGVGIGLFILFIGFVNGGLISAGEAVPVQFVFPNSAGASVTLIGLLITIALWVKKVPGALILSILLTTVVAFILGVQTWPETLTATPNFDVLGNFDLGNVFSTLGTLSAILVIFSFMLTDFFDTMGTATAIVEQAGLADEDGNIEDIGKLLLVDSLGAVAGGMGGVSSNTSYIESSAGVAEGGRTGFTSVVTGALFLVAIFLAPLAGLIPSVATAPVLIFVGFLMTGLLKDIDFQDVEEGLPALLTMIMMPLTYSITEGIGAGFVAWVLIKVIKGKAADVHPLMWVVAGGFVLFFAKEWIGTII